MTRNLRLHFVFLLRFYDKKFELKFRIPFGDFMTRNLSVPALSRSCW